MKIKKVVAGILAFSMLCGVVCTDNSVISEFFNSVSVSAENLKLDNGLSYKVNGEGTGITITDCDESATEIEIPAEIDGLPVTSIGHRSFENCTSLTTVKIPDSVTIIDVAAFSYCESLTEITIPDSVTSICNGAFGDCKSLTEITIPNSVAIIYDSAFSDCKSLTEVTIQDSVTSIGRGTFSGCTSLTEVTIPDSVINIGAGAFDETPFLKNQTTDVKYAGKCVIDCEHEAKEVKIRPDTIAIADRSFASRGSLTTVSIPDSVKRIGQSAFSDCKSLTEVTIPDSVTSIGSSAFYNCSSLTKVIIPNSVTSIEYNAFGCCTSLTSITIPDSVKRIGQSAFSDCKSLTEVTIPDSVTSIGSHAFDETPFLENLLENQTTDVKYAGKWVIDCNEVATEVEIRPDTVGIADSAFWNCKSLTEIKITDSVISIGECAFYDCISLTEITIPDSITCIGYDAFAGTPFLENQTTDVKYAGKWAVDYNVYTTEVEIKPDTVGIGNGAFYGMRPLTEVTIPDSVIIIGDNAFKDCESLTEVTIPDSVTIIGDCAFGYYLSYTNCGYVKVENFTIYGVKGSAAETYAVENGFKFVEMESTPAKKTGDLDGDGEITSNDSLNLLQLVVGGKDLTEEQKKLADLDGDGEITSSDALIALQIVVGLR